MIAKIPAEITTAKRKWETDLSLDPLHDWSNNFTLAYQVTQETKIIEFQFKLLYRCITTNTKLYILGIKTNNRCTFCNLYKETPVHLFWECVEIKNMWKNLFTWLNDKLNIDINPGKADIILGKEFPMHSTFINKVILNIKYYIYVSRCLDRHPDIAGAKNRIQHFLLVEKGAGIKMHTKFLEDLF